MMHTLYSFSVVVVNCYCSVTEILVRPKNRSGRTKIYGNNVRGILVRLVRLCSMKVQSLISCQKEPNRCHVRMGTPHFRDPGSQYLYEIGDPGPYLHIIILGTPDP